MPKISRLTPHLLGISAMVRLFTFQALIALALPIYAEKFSGYQGTTFPLEQNAGTPDLFFMPPCGSFELEEATIDDMQQAMARGDLTSVQLTICYMQRTYQLQGYTK